MTSASLARLVRDGDRRALARAITLVESTRLEDRAAAGELLNELLNGDTPAAIRVGISGAPGVGKSTLIEALGSHIIDQGHRVAVLAVDPSSARSGGSILGDKTRMESLARAPEAYIRPSPSGGAAGGVARRTREAMLVCEAAGFDVVLVETVGVGQSDTAVSDMVDVFVLLVAPGGGDELQGIKRGVMELADVVVVTKSDGDLANAATQTTADYKHALHLLRPKRPEWQPNVLLCSALRGDGIAAVWDTIVDQRQALERTSTLEDLRCGQAVAWFWNELRERVVSDLTNDATLKPLIAELESAVAAGDLSPGAAADRLLAER